MQVGPCFMGGGGISDSWVDSSLAVWLSENYDFNIGLFFVPFWN